MVLNIDGVATHGVTKSSSSQVSRLGVLDCPPMINTLVSLE